MYKVCIGIDPGKHGGIAAIILTDEDVHADVIPMPVGERELDVTSIERFIQQYVKSERDAICYIEKVSAMPNQGVVSMFNFGYNAGMINGVIASLHIPRVHITPQAWKKITLQGTDKSKQAAIDYCLRMYPKVNLKETARCTTYHDGMADSLCIAHTARIAHDFRQQEGN